MQETEDSGSTSGLGRYPEGGNGNLLQYFCLGKSMDRGAWWITIHGVRKEWDMTWQLNNSNNNMHCHSVGSLRPVCACQHSTIQMKVNRVLGPSHEGCLRGPTQVPTLHLNLPAFTGNASLARKPHTTNHSPPSLL